MKLNAQIVVNGFGERNERSLLIITSKDEVIEGMKELASKRPTWSREPVLDQEASRKTFEKQVRNIKTEDHYDNKAYKKFLLAIEEKNLLKLKDLLSQEQNENKTIKELKEEYASNGGLYKKVPSPEEYIEQLARYKVYDYQSDDGKMFDSLVDLLDDNDITIRDFADGNGVHSIPFTGSISEIVTFSFQY